ncbi:MAG: xanthine dehydrogenase family protein molybdopterin-binding subunit [Deltaproteobacteria bacterium]|nr:MAG: xanthine dehydrogenase family protein molybdopterin-binding subunit [Deltaproteobacteria bacterium]
MKYLNRKSPRFDAADKVTGRLVYPSDKTMDGMLWVEVVRSAHPYARIRGIDTSRAEAVDGVVSVLTAKDVPGQNAFGIQIQDQPVLCHDFVRYEGDAVALVGAETPDAARRAARLVEVDYEVLEPVCDPEFAMRPEAPRLHPRGNILHEGHFSKGDVEEGFSKSAVVIEDTYEVPMMDHAYLEPEAGLSWYDGGVLVVDSCGQYVFRDQAQIARALGLPLEKVRVISSQVGGAFGGKDEITVQIHLALMTYHTRRPAKMVATRRDSIVSHTKRHPARIWYKTGASRSGKLLAVQARFVSDTGAYASLGGPVLNLMMEHAAGPYLVPNVKVDAYAVYTNNGFSGAFRGFGCTQACLALESQMDRMARALGMDPLAFRRKNVLHKGDRAGLGYTMKLEVGAEATVRSAQRGKLWRNRRQLKKPPKNVPPSLRRYIRRGIGVATQMQGLGLGIGIPDYAEVEVELMAGGRARLRVGTTEIGQGAYETYRLTLAERLSLPPENVEVTGGDTGLAPDSGTTTASRTAYAVGNAILLACDRLESRLAHEAEKRFGWSDGNGSIEGSKFRGAGGVIDLEQLMAGRSISERATFHVPVQDVEMGDGLPHLLYSYGTHVVLVQVDTLTGEISVEAIEAHLDGGQVLNRLGFEGQSEGGIGQGIGYALMEQVLLDRGRFLNTNFDTYIIPSSVDVPWKIKTVPVMVKDSTGPFGAKGISETCTVGVAPAILNAIEDAIGVRLTKLPVRAENVLEALGERKDG